MEETFQILYDAYHQDLYQFLFYMVKDKSQAEIWRRKCISAS